MPRGFPGQLCEIVQSVLANLQLGVKDTPHTRQQTHTNEQACRFVLFH